MATDDGSAATIESPDQVDDATVVEWGIRNPVTGSTVIMDARREDTERRLRQLTHREPDYPALLVSRTVRRRTETWLGPVEVVPWHTPCEWVGQADERGRGIPGTTRCYAHDHREGEPIPAEHIRGATDE